MKVPKCIQLRAESFEAMADFSVPHKGLQLRINKRHKFGAPFSQDSFAPANTDCSDAIFVSESA